MFKWFSSSKKKDEKLKEKEQLPVKEKIHVLKIKKKMNLPRNFAKKVIDLELLCDRLDVTRENVNSLMDVYTVKQIFFLLFLLIITIF
jgi:hypothetical protein